MCSFARWFRRTRGLLSEEPALAAGFRERGFPKHLSLCASHMSYMSYTSHYLGNAGHSQIEGIRSFSSNIAITEF